MHDDRACLRDTLSPGEAIYSLNLRYELVLEDDGNLALRRVDSGARMLLWQTGTWGRADPRLVMQRDGNLVLYSGTEPLFATGTGGNPGAYSHLQDDGNFVIRRPDGFVVWSTRTWQRTSPLPNLGEPRISISMLIPRVEENAED